MASKSDIEAGKAYVTLYMKNSALLKGLTAVQSQLKKLASGLKQFGEDVGKIGRSIAAVGLSIGVTLAAGIAKVVSKTPELAGVATAFESVRASVENLFVQITTALAPALIDMSTKFSVIVNGFADFISKNKEMVVSFAKGLVIFTGVGVAIVALGKSFALAGSAISVANTLITVSSTVASAAITGMGIAMAALSSPIGIVVAIMGAVTFEVVRASGAFDEAGTNIRSSVTAMANTTMAAFGGIRDALASGDIALAANIAWLGVKVVWQQGVDGIMTIWDRFITGFYKAWVNLQSLITQALLGTAGFITRQVQRIINAINNIPGMNIKANVEFDSAGAIRNVRQDAANSITERERVQQERKRDREALISGLSKELGSAIDEARRKAELSSKVPSLPQTPELPPGVTSPGELTKEQILAQRRSKIIIPPDSRPLVDGGAFGTFSAGGINQALGVGGPAQKQLDKLDKIAATEKAMLDELKRIKLEFTA